MDKDNVNSSTFLVGQSLQTLRAEIGQVVEIIDDWKGERVYEVEFTNSKGRMSFTKFFLRNA